jgi:hypothetical protein
MVAGAIHFAASEYYLFDPSGRWLTAYSTSKAATRTALFIVLPSRGGRARP